MRRILVLVSAAASLVLGSPGDDALMNAIVVRIEAADISVTTVGLDARIDDDSLHRARFREAIAEIAGSLIIGGFSLGARIAASLCPQVAPRALLGFGYPFHAPKDVEMRRGLDALSQVGVPTRIIQGARDPHGTEAEVEQYRLPDCVQVSWLADGNHRFVPRQRSGFTQEDHIVAAAELAISFIRSQ